MIHRTDGPDPDDRLAESRAALVGFMRTFTVPPGELPLSLLQRAGPLMNDGGPEVDVERRRPVGEVPGWKVSVDLYRPRATTAHGLVLFLHGGGWVMGSPTTHDRIAREIADRGFLVASVDYPRAPRCRFPAGLDGARLALAWLYGNASSLGLDPSTLTVVGDSAGANLAAALATADLARIPPIRGLGLLYGVFDFHAALPIVGPLVGGTSAAEQLYVEPAEFEVLSDDPRLNPIRAAGRMPATWLCAGSSDPLVGESRRLDDALTVAGVRHEYVEVPAAPHAFLQMPFVAGYEQTLDRMATFLHGCSEGDDVRRP